MNRATLSLCLVLVFAGIARAHPIPKNNHDRTITVRLTPKAVIIEYVLEVDELTAVNDLPRAEWARLTDRREFFAVFLKYFAPVLSNNLVASLDGEPLEFTCVSRQFKVLDHLRCEYRFEAEWKLTPGKEHAFTIRESNYDLDSVSKVLLSVGGESGIKLERVTAPNATLQAKAADDRGPGDDERLRKASATFLLDETTKPAPPIAEAEPPAAEVPNTPRKLADLIYSKLGIGLLLLFAAAFGAAHALTPGHGKTLVAAYLVGERGTVWHAFVLGLVTTITHTAAVLILALVLWLYYGSRIPPGVAKIIGLVGGFMVAGLGLWLFTRRVSGQADHVHLGDHGHGHGHGDHDHGHSHGHGVGLGPLVWLGIGGGIVPCWDAIALLTGALQAGLVWLGPALILAFSAGLASVLIAIGIGVVYARRHVDARSGGSARLRTLVRVLPLLSALAVTVLGLWMCYDSVHGSP